MEDILHHLNILNAQIEVNGGIEHTVKGTYLFTLNRIRGLVNAEIRREEENLKAFLNWKLFVNCAGAGIALVILILAGIVFYKCFMYIKNDGNQESDLTPFSAVGSSMFIIISTIAFFDFSINAIKIVIAPRVYLIEWVANTF